MTESLIAGEIDFVIIGIVLIINLIIYRKKLKWHIGCVLTLLIGLLFGLILPIISQVVEIGKIMDEREVMDNFTLLYTYSRYPLYWLMGTIQFAILSTKR